MCVCVCVDGRNRRKSRMPDGHLLFWVSLTPSSFLFSPPLLFLCYWVKYTQMKWNEIRQSNFLYCLMKLFRYIHIHNDIDVMDTIIIFPNSNSIRSPSSSSTMALEFDSWSIWNTLETNGEWNGNLIFDITKLNIWAWRTNFLFLFSYLVGIK